MKFLNFDPPKIKNRFFKYNGQKIQKVFLNFEKNGIYVIVPIAFYSHPEVEIDTSFFGQVIAKKMFKIDDVKLNF